MLVNVGRYRVLLFLAKMLEKFSKNPFWVVCKIFPQVQKVLRYARYFLEGSILRMTSNKGGLYKQNSDLESRLITA